MSKKIYVCVQPYSSAFCGWRRSKAELCLCLIFSYSGLILIVNHSFVIKTHHLKEAQIAFFNAVIEDLGLSSYSVLYLIMYLWMSASYPVICSLSGVITYDFPGDKDVHV